MYRMLSSTHTVEMSYLPKRNVSRSYEQWIRSLVIGLPYRFRAKVMSRVRNVPSTLPRPCLFNEKGVYMQETCISIGLEQYIRGHNRGNCVAH